MVFIKQLQGKIIEKLLTQNDYEHSIHIPWQLCKFIKQPGVLHRFNDITQQGYAYKLEEAKNNLRPFQRHW